MKGKRRKILRKELCCKSQRTMKRTTRRVLTSASGRTPVNYRQHKRVCGDSIIECFSTQSLNNSIDANAYKLETDSPIEKEKRISMTSKK